MTAPTTTATILKLLPFATVLSCVCVWRSAQVIQPIDDIDGILLSSDNNKRVDGYFNGFPLQRVNEAPQTHVHCVGDNFNETSSWIFTSCQYQNAFCWDIHHNEFVVFPADPVVDGLDGTSSVSTNPQKVAGGSQPRWWWPGKIMKKYKDEITEPVGQMEPKTYTDIRPPPFYYQLPPSVVWATIYRHPKSYRNPGHLIWDDFLGLYTLLDTFDELDKHLLLSQLERSFVPPYGGAEGDTSKDVIHKFAPLLGLHHDYPFKIEEEYDISDDLDWTDPNNGKTVNQRLICASRGVQGSGVFSDHGHDHWHGQVKLDFERPHNVGRGGLLRRFRNWMLNENLFQQRQTTIRRDPAYKIVIAQNSSTKEDRRGIEFRKQVSALQKRFRRNRLEVIPVQLDTLSLIEQIELVQDAAFFLSMVGGGTVTAFFLPQHANIFLYPSRKFLDYDLWNNFPLVKTHWMPQIDLMDEKASIDYLVDSVEREMKALDQILPAAAISSKKRRLRRFIN